jgi:hypothetical protein
MDIRKETKKMAGLFVRKLLSLPSGMVQPGSEGWNSAVVKPTGAENRRQKGKPE